MSESTTAGRTPETLDAVPSGNRHGGRRPHWLNPRAAGAAGAAAALTVAVAGLVAVGGGAQAAGSTTTALPAHPHSTPSAPTPSDPAPTEPADPEASSEGSSRDPFIPLVVAESDAEAAGGVAAIDGTVGFPAPVATGGTTTEPSSSTTPAPATGGTTTGGTTTGGMATDGTTADATTTDGTTATATPTAGDPDAETVIRLLEVADDNGSARIESGSSTYAVAPGDTLPPAVGVVLLDGGRCGTFSHIDLVRFTLCEGESKTLGD